MLPLECDDAGLRDELHLHLHLGRRPELGPTQARLQRDQLRNRYTNRYRTLGRRTGGRAMSGFMRDSLMLADINECDSNPCAYATACNNQVGYFECVCMEGYTGVLCDQVGLGRVPGLVRSGLPRPRAWTSASRAPASTPTTPRGPGAVRTSTRAGSATASPAGRPRTAAATRTAATSTSTSAPRTPASTPRSARSRG